MCSNRSTELIGVSAGDPAWPANASAERRYVDGKPSPTSDALPDGGFADVHLQEQKRGIVSPRQHRRCRTLALLARHPPGLDHTRNMRRS
jgi:hypothetical protein